MWKQKLFLFMSLALAAPAWAAMPRPLPLPSEAHLTAAVERLEQALGEELTPEQVAQLSELAKNEKPRDFVQIARSPHKSIYCAGVRAAAVQSYVGAKCIHFGSLQAYDMVLLGFGVSFQLTGSVFKLKVTYDPSRYDESFDPVPGNYYAMVMGATVIGGLSTLQGSSGNKQISGGSINLGAGIDYTFAGWVVIQ